MYESRNIMTHCVPMGLRYARLEPAGPPLPNLCACNWFDTFSDADLELFVSACAHLPSDVYG